jgi:AraC family transcriptional regulator
MPAETIARIHRFERQYEGLHLFTSVHDGGLTVPRHTHQHASMYVVLAGSIREQRAAGDRDIDAGGFVFAPAEETHGNVVAARGARCFLVELDRTWAGGMRALRDRHEVAGGPPAFLMLRLLADAAADDELASEESAWRVIGELARIAFRRQQSGPRWIARTEEQLRAGFTCRLRLAALAEDAGVHPVHLAAAFRARTGCTIGTYLRRLRIARACSLLAAGVPLADVSLQTGFADQSQFTKTFARLMGMPPGAFRRRTRLCT